jgi:hypothetical protein
VFVAAGKRGALKRWGPQRVVRLDSLDPTVAAVIRAIIDANEKAAAVSETPATAEPEVRRASGERPAL